MTIQHNAISDPNIHEPKGIAASASNQAYIANGAGSGTWKKIDATTIKGSGSDGGISGLKLISDGTEGFALVKDFAYGGMNIIGNTNNFALTAVADTTLGTASQYTLFTGTGAPWALSSASDVTFLTDRLTVGVQGVYELSVWANINGFPSATAKVGLRYRTGGVTFSTKAPICKSGAAGDVCQLVMTEFVTLGPTDYLQIYVASDATGNLIVQHMNVTLKLIRAT